MSRQLLRHGRRFLSSNEGLRFLDRLQNYERSGIPDQTSGQSFRLDRLKTLLWNLGDPQNQLRVIHVAGSKGKGSVATFLASMLSASGLKSGLCTSPHILDVTERISLTTDDTDGTLAPITSSNLNNLITEHKALIEETKTTYFESLIALSLVHFVRNGAKHAVVETGLGGVTDATNIFEDENIDATVVCPLEKEHLNQLGDDIESIVANELGIIKTLRPVVVAEQSSADLLNQILRICESKKGQVRLTDGVSVEHHSFKETERDLRESVHVRIRGDLVHQSGDLRFERIETRLIGHHQHRNIRTAISAALVAKRQGWKITEKAIQRGIRDAFLPGRFQICRSSIDAKWLVLDGAHSPDSAKALATNLRAIFPEEPLVLILCMVKDKDHEAVLNEMIQAKPDVVIFTSISATDRALPPGTLLAHWEKCEMLYRKKQPYRCRKTLTANISTAIFKAKTELEGIDKPNARSPGVICLSGTLYAIDSHISTLDFINSPLQTIVAEKRLLVRTERMSRETALFQSASETVRSLHMCQSRRRDRVARRHFEKRVQCFGMFESWISNLLASSLGQFVDVKTDQLRISLWEGVIIENARVRSDAFDHLRLPFEVKHGIIGKLHVQVPWRALHLSPIVVHVSDIAITFAPHCDWSHSGIRERKRRARHAEIVAAELRRVSTKVASSSTLLWRIGAQLWNTVLQRLQLKIERIRIAFEGQRVSHLPVYTFGIEVDDICTEEGMEIAEHQPRNPVEGIEILKALSVQGLSLFWRPDTSETSRIKQSLLSALSFRIFVYVRSQSHSTRGIEFEAYIVFSHMSWSLDQRQIVSIASFADDLILWQKRSKYGHHRPENWMSRFERRRERQRQKALLDCDALWKYAIQSVLQDISEQVPTMSFSGLRMRRYSEWRRNYLPLYCQKLEEESRGRVVSTNLRSKLELAEELMPVYAIMLFRSIAEDCCLHKAEGKESASQHWLRWSLSNTLGFFRLSSEIDPLLKEAPNDEQIQNIYEKLGTTESESQLAAFSAKVEVGIGEVTLQLSSTTMDLLGFKANDVHVEADISDGNQLFVASVQTIEAIDLTSNKNVRFLRFNPRSSNSCISVSYDSDHPVAEVQMSGLHLDVYPSLLGKLNAIRDQLPSLTHSRWMQYSCCALSTKRSRIRSQLRTPWSIPSISVRIFSPQICIPSTKSGQRLCIHATNINAESAMDEAEDAQDLSCLNTDDVFVNEIIDQLVYTKWTTSVFGVSVSWEEDDEVSHRLIEPFSATGNLYFNPFVLEESLPTMITDWRSAPLLISCTSAVINGLSHLLLELREESNCVQMVDNCNALSSDGLDFVAVQLSATSDKVTVKLEEVFTPYLQDFFTRKGEASFAAEKLKLSLDFGYEDRDRISTVYTLLSHTAALHTVLEGDRLKLDCSVRALSFQDATDYGAQRPPLQHGLPRLGRSLTVKDVSASFHNRRGQTERSRISFAGVDGNGYLNEAGSQVHSNNSQNQLTLQSQILNGKGHSELELDNFALGASFLLRLHLFLSPPANLTPGEFRPPWTILKIVESNVSIRDSYFVFPTSYQIYPTSDVAHILLHLPEFLLKRATAEIALDDGRQSVSVQEFDALKLTDARIFLDSPKTDEELLTSLLTISNVNLSSKCLPSVAEMKNGGFYQSRDCRYSFEVGNVSGCLESRSLDALVQTVLALRTHILEANSVPVMSDDSETTGSSGSLDLRNYCAIDLAKLQVFFSDDHFLDSPLFVFDVAGISLSHDLRKDRRSVSLSWKDAAITVLQRRPEVETYLLTADGLRWRRRRERSEGFDVDGSLQGPKSESCDDEDSGSVSSSTSWQTAGSQISASRRTSGSGQMTTDFESVAEVAPLQRQDADHELTPCTEAASPSIESKSTAEEAFQRSPEDVDVKLDLTLVKFEKHDDRPLIWNLSEDSVSTTVPVMTFTVNLTCLTELITAVQSLVEVIDLGQRQRSSTLTKPARTISVTIVEAVLSVCHIPQLSQKLLVTEPPRLHTTIRLQDLEACLSSLAMSVKLSDFSLESTWMKCLNPAPLQLHQHLELGKLFSATDLCFSVKLPFAVDSPGIHNIVAVDLDVGDVLFDLSIRKLQPMKILMEYYSSQRPLHSVPSGPFPDESNALSTSISLQRHRRFVIYHHSTVAVNIRSVVVHLTDDSGASSFPLLKITVNDICLEMESLSDSDLAVWDLHIKPAVEIYNCQLLCWECLLGISLWNAAGRCVIAATDETFPRRPVQYISIRLISSTAVDLTISLAMIQSAQHLMKFCTSLKDAETTCEAVPVVSYWIKNLTGSQVECTILDSVAEVGTPLLLKPEECQPLSRREGIENTSRIGDRCVLYDDASGRVDVEEYELNLRAQLEDSELRLSFRLEDQLLPCGPLSLNKTGVVCFSILSDSAIVPVTGNASDPIDRLFNRSLPKKTVLQCRVQPRDDGAVEVELCSAVEMLNETAYRIEVGCWTVENVRPQLKYLEPMESFWLPLMSVTHGRFTVRPHPESTDRFVLRCAWCQPISIDNAPIGAAFTKLTCHPISGGLKPIWLHVAIERRPQPEVSTVRIQAPVIFHNYLPVPLHVAVSCDSGKSTALKGRLAPRCSMQGYTIQGKDITTLKLVPGHYPSADICPSVLDIPSATVGEFAMSVDDVRATEIEFNLGSGLIPISVHHKVEGTSGRHVFEICCPLWIYNCTDSRLSVRETQHRVLVEEEQTEDDVVPDRWISPISDINSRASGAVRATSALGLQTLLEKGEPERFRLRSGVQKLAPVERRDRFVERSGHASMEVSGPSNQGPFRLQFRTCGSQAPFGSDFWSVPVSMDGSGSAAVVRCAHPMHATSTSPALPNAAYFLAITCTPIPRCGEASAVRVMPRYILKNSTPFHLQYRQQGIRVEKELPVDVIQNIHWPDFLKPLLLSIRIQEAGWMWSGGLVVDTPGDTIVKLRHRVREETMLVQMDVSLQSSGVLLATLVHQSAGFAPYRLDNFTSEKIHVRQYKSGSQEDVLRPYSSMPYAWDEPSGPHKVILEGVARKLIGVVNLDAIGEETRTVLVHELGDGYSEEIRRLKITIQAEGPTRVLAVLDEQVHPHITTPFNRLHSSAVETIRSPFANVGRERGIAIDLQLPTIGISLVSAEREMIYLHFSAIGVMAKVDDARISVQCSIDQFQIDTCLRRVKYPVLAQGPVAQESWTEVMSALLSRRAFDASLSVWRQRPGGVICMEDVTIDLAPVRISAEEQSLRELLYFIRRFSPISVGTEDGKSIADDTFSSAYRQVSTSVPRQKIHIEELSVSPWRVTFSFCPVSRNGDTEHVAFLQRVASLANFEGAQIRLNALKLSHPLMSVPALATLIGRHYTVSILQEFYKVVGSADILGDPVHFVRHLGLGVWLLFANPTYALVRSRTFEPGRLLAGCIAGVTSLFSNVTIGFANATAKMSEAFRRGLTMFIQLQTPRQSARNSTDLLLVTLESAVGVLSSASKGLDEKGLYGFCRGLIMGLTRFVVNPVAAILELISDLTRSISQSLSESLINVRFSRVPRHVIHGRSLEPYAQLTAIGAGILQEAENGRFACERLYACFECSESSAFVLVSRLHLLCAEWKTPVCAFTKPVLTTVIRLEDVECVWRQGTIVTLFGFVPSACWRAQMLLMKSSGSPFFVEKVHCKDVASSWQLTLVLKIATEHVPRRTVKFANGYRISYV